MISPKEDINKFVSEYLVENHEQALARAGNLIQKYPREIKLLQILGITFAQNNKFKDAIVIFKKILNHDLQSIETFINIGITYYEFNKLDEALEYLEKAKNLGIRQSEVYYNFGLVYEKKNETRKALTYYKQAIENDSSNIGAFLNIGNIHVR